MEARARYSGYQLQHLTRRQFGIAMKQALLELQTRGLGVGADLSQSKISTNLSQICDLARDYSQVLAYDGVMQSYLHSHCPLWSDEKPLYRGGDVQREARRKRRSKKGKGFFKPESENINGEALGKGVYLTGLKSEAVRYASGGMTKLWLKEPLKKVSRFPFQASQWLKKDQKWQYRLLFRLFYQCNLNFRRTDPMVSLLTVFF